MMLTPSSPITDGPEPIGAAERVATALASPTDSPVVHTDTSIVVAGSSRSTVPRRSPGPPIALRALQQTTWPAPCAGLRPACAARTRAPPAPAPAPAPPSAEVIAVRREPELHAASAEASIIHAIHQLNLFGHHWFMHSATQSITTLRLEGGASKKKTGRGVALRGMGLKLPASCRREPARGSCRRRSPAAAEVRRCRS